MVFSASQYSVEDAARVQISASSLSNHETLPQRRMDRYSCVIVREGSPLLLRDLFYGNTFLCCLQQHTDAASSSSCRNNLYTSNHCQSIMPMLYLYTSWYSRRSPPSLNRSVYGAD